MIFPMAGRQAQRSRPVQFSGRRGQWNCRANGVENLYLIPCRPDPAEPGGAALIRPLRAAAEKGRPEIRPGHSRLPAPYRLCRHPGHLPPGRRHDPGRRHGGGHAQRAAQVQGVDAERERNGAGLHRQQGRPQPALRVQVRLPLHPVRPGAEDAG
jgi:hypothetical protein